MQRLAITIPANGMLLLASVSLCVYFLFSVGNRTVQLYQLKQEEAQLQAELRTLDQQRQSLLEERDQLLTGTYVEKIAREELNLIKHGETAVVVLPTKDAVVRMQEELRVEQHTAAPNPIRWWEWLFGS